MNRAELNYFIDIGLGISFLIVFITGIIRLPGLLSSLGISYSSVNTGNVSMLHDRAGIAMGILVITHIILHWGWIMSMTRVIFRGKRPEHSDSD